MDVLIAIVAQVAMIYLTGVIMIIGFAMMLGGPRLAGRVAAWGLGQPLQSIERLSLRVVRAIALGIGRAGVAVARAFLTHVVDPIIRLIDQILLALLRGGR